MDLLDYLNNKKDKKILIIGCGLKNLLEEKHYDPNKNYEIRRRNIQDMLKFENLTLSDDISISKEFLIENGIDPKRYKKVDLFNPPIIDNYDYIDLRFVLHLINPKENRIGIIDKLINILNKNGEVGIQCYLNKEEEIHYPLNDEEMMKIRKKFCIAEFEFEDNHSDKCKTIIIKKSCLLVYLFNQVRNINCSFFFKKFY